MGTFFGILFILIGINAVMMIFSLGGASQKTKKSESGVETPTIKIFPIDFISSKYKKAV